MPTTCGSRIRRGHRPVANAAAVERLEAAGAIVVGKLAMTEFAFVSHHPDLPDPPNPHASDRSPGGSSSGSAIAAAAGLAFATLGSDTVASIRLPAAWCGAVGLKPTWGRVPRHGVFPLAASFDTVGPITRCVADAALTLRCIAGPDARDPTARHDPLDAPRPIGDLSGVRFGWDEAFATTDVAPDVVASCRGAARALEARGAERIETTLPERALLLETYEALLALEIRQAHLATFPSRADDYGRSLRECLDECFARDPMEHVEAAVQARGLRHRLSQWFGDFDVFLSPVAPFPAPPRAPDHRDLAMVPGGLRTLLGLTRFTWPWNLTGSPAIALPWGTDPSGLPLAVQLVAPVARDVALLAIAETLEADPPLS